MENSKSHQIREMYLSDLVHVIDIIDSHDDDDAEEAYKDLSEHGVEGQFVLIEAGSVIGTSGYRSIEGCDRTYWLSWTYLSKEKCGNGLGRIMLSGVLEKLENLGARKIFIKVSNYQDEQGNSTYASALSLYKKLGFSEELINYNFYDEGEDQIILGLSLDNKQEQNTTKEIAINYEKPIIRFTGFYEIAETEGAYSYSWTVNEKKSFFEKRGFSNQDIELGLASVKEVGGRIVCLTFPSNLVLIHQPLQQTGFKFVGQLEDYYEEGLHEMHFVHNLDE